MKQPKKRPAAFPAIARRFILLMLAVWLTVMALLTWAVAGDFRRQMTAEAQEYAEHRASRDSVYSDDPYGDLSGSLECAMIQRLGWPYISMQAEQLLPIVLPHLPSSMGSSDWYWGKWDLVYGYEAAVIYYDEDQNILMQSGNYLTFTFSIVDELGRRTDGESLGRGYVDLDTLANWGKIDQLLWDYPSGLISWIADDWCPYMTGYFEGSEFHPTHIEFRNGYQSTNSWDTGYAVPEDCDASLVTIYAWDLDGIRSHFDPVTVNGTRFETLPELLHGACTDNGYYTTDNLWESILIRQARHQDEYGAYTLAIAVRCWPLQYAMARLVWVYLVSLAVLGFLTFLILNKIKYSFTLPLEGVAKGQYLEKPNAGWKEAYEVQEHYVNSKKALHEANTQIQQLNTALDYAHDAEASRRQLVSNLAHELKTPLSVIHSYAEGLQAGIAQEKQDQYLSVILEESEKMDAMVLQMLDLSRLEAGKVRLASDPVNLLELTQRVFEKLSLASQAKGLRVHYGLSQSFTVTADEARIRQVITNLASNAVKYTPEGGEIWITALTRAGMAHIAMANTHPPLSQEALDKVFTSFYRADPSRTEGGTGLGLTIVKTIVELHRGTCAVKNTTRDGRSVVEFSFTLPMG